MTDAAPDAVSEPSREPSTFKTDPEVLTVDELAALLRVERKTAYAAVARGEIPGARRVGRSIRISRDAVLEWLHTAQVRAPRSRRKT
jgi:excisionase family DNA binding protein